MAATLRPVRTTQRRRGDRRAGGLTDDLITLQERWEAYLDEQDILDFATVQRRFQQRQAAVIAAP